MLKQKLGYNFKFCLDSPFCEQGVTRALLTLLERFPALGTNQIIGSQEKLLCVMIIYAIVQALYPNQ